jgi:hypothetical protein
MPNSWWELPLHSTELPYLLVSAVFDADSYVISLSDTANLWEERLERKAICMRGFQEDTAVDPSEGPDQMKIFLSKLEAALRPLHVEHGTTSMSLTPAKETAEEGGLTLNITCQLPDGLPPLKWPVYLKKAPPSKTATELVLRLIEAHSARIQEVESLIEIIAQKDAAMVKILDKLEATGTGLDQVFTALAGKRKVARETVGDRVKGLAPFDEKDWRETLASYGEVPSDVSGLLRRVFGGKGLQYDSTIEICDSPGLDMWWTKIDSITSAPGPGQKKTVPKEKTPSPQATGFDDDFQVQATPPHLMSSRKRAAPSSTIANDDESTADETEDAIPDSNPPPLASLPDAKRARELGKLGALGRNKPRKESSAPPEQPIAEQGDELETASEADPDETASLSDAEIPPKLAPNTPRKGELSRIRGLAKAGDSQTRLSVSSPPSRLASESAGTPVRPKKLGVIGRIDRNARDDPKQGNDEVAPRGRTRNAADEEKVKEEPRETSQERANRKRAELQREMARKAAAGPVKKKRRF